MENIILDVGGLGSQSKCLIIFILIKYILKHIYIISYYCFNLLSKEWLEIMRLKGQFTQNWSLSSFTRPQVVPMSFLYEFLSSVEHKIIYLE